MLPICLQETCSAIHVKTSPMTTSRSDVTCREKSMIGNNSVLIWEADISWLSVNL